MYMIHETLKKLGFSDKEAEIYLTILQQGKIAPTDVAKLTKINRSTVYDVAKELIRRGVITEDLGSSVRYFVALPPQDLSRLTQKEERVLSAKKLLVSSAIKELSSLAKNIRYSVPKIQFYSENEISNHLYRQTSIWNTSIAKSDGYWWGFQDISFVEHYKPWLEWYWKNHSDKGVRLLSNAKEDKEVTKGGFHSNRDIRYWENAQDFTATLWVIGDYLIMIVTKQRPHYLVEIHDSIMAHNQRQVFKGIWESLK